MDFFQNQDVARKKTGLLIFYFALAVVTIIALVYVAIALALRLSESSEGSGPSSSSLDLWNPWLFGLVALGTSAFILGGSLYKIASLSGGGHTVAELLGGRLLHSGTADPDERRVLNVVEEMAIASGVPVPPVYLLEGEPGINAFAAGYGPGDAVIAVTSGSIQLLSRDELQGVIAHEFSHILNGDMRLNMRLMGVLFGILLIGLTGWLIFRTTGSGNYRSGDRRDGNSRRENNALPLIGLALYVIGYAGVFFGNLIKAAVSRQREYLADASAVQFTRNPEGIAGALKKIGALAEGSHIQNPRAEEASHMFFGNAVGGTGQLFGLIASHPPLVDRIRRIDPSFDGDFTKVRLETPRDEEPTPKAPQRDTSASPMPFDPVQAVASVGTVGPAHLAYAAALLDTMPPALSEVVREPLGAQAAVYAMLLDPDESVRMSQLAWLETNGPPALVRQTQRILPETLRLGPESRLPLVELAVPALRQMSPAQAREFNQGVEALVQADRKTTLFEYALQRLLIRHVLSHFRGVRPTTVKYDTSPPLIGSISVVLSALARSGSTIPAEIARAFAEGVRALGWPAPSPELADEGAVSIESIDAALKQLASASPALKKQILEACATCIGVDGRVTVEEGELLRAISDSLGCPMPPVLAPGDIPMPTPAA
jgi:Zn-dependent protease with chaperone function